MEPDDIYEDVPYTYLRLDEVILAQVPDNELSDCIVFSLLRMLGASRIGRTAEFLPLIPRPFRAIYAVWNLRGEVRNGGFNQYFWNTEGRQADAALEGLALIGADAAHSITQEAVRIQEQEIGMMTRFQRLAHKWLRRGRLGRAWAVFATSYEHTGLEQMDDRFNTIDGPLYDLMTGYIRSHPEYFVLQKSDLAGLPT